MWNNVGADGTCVLRVFVGSNPVFLFRNGAGKSMSMCGCAFGFLMLLDWIGRFPGKTFRDSIGFLGYLRPKSHREKKGWENWPAPV